MTMEPNSETSAAYSNTARCIVCGDPLDLRPTQGRRSRKPSLMFVCPEDGRHFRAFVTFQPFVEAVLSRLEGRTPGEEAGEGANPDPDTTTRSKTILERPS